MPQFPDTKLDKQATSPNLPGHGRILIAQGESGNTGKPVTSPATHATTEAQNEEAPAGEIPSPWLLLWNSATVMLVMVVLAVIIQRSLKRIPRRLGIENIGEYIVESLNTFTTGIIGPGGERYTPLVGTIFIYILVSNLWGLIPGMHSPTSNISMTLALGIIVFVYVQYEGIRQNGLGGHLKHFAGPIPAMSPFMFLIEMISEIVKPFTLAIRLFGNIFGEDVIIIVLTGLLLQLSNGNALLGIIPLQFPILLLALLTAGVQALVFSMLTCIYISLVSHHEHEGPHGEDSVAAEGHHAH